MSSAPPDNNQQDLFPQSFKKKANYRADGLLPTKLLVIKPLGRKAHE